MRQPIDRIEIGIRYRKNLGDLERLRRSISSIGLLHPIVVTASGQLIAGQRRLEACKALGWQEIPVRIVDIENPTRGEYDENTVRKDFTPSEAVAIWQAMENHQGKRELVSESDTSKRRDRAARATGLGRDKLHKAKAVVESAEENPEIFAEVVEKGNPEQDELPV